jgi:hypothetical protein
MPREAQHLALTAGERAQGLGEFTAVGERGHAVGAYPRGSCRQARCVLAGDGAAPVDRPAGVEHAGPGVGEAALWLVQPGRAPVQAFENVLDDILGCGEVAHHDQRETHEFQVMLAEQFGQADPGPVLAILARSHKAHTEETPIQGIALRAQPAGMVLSVSPDSSSCGTWAKEYLLSVASVNVQMTSKRSSGHAFGMTVPWTKGSADASAGMRA